MKQEGQSPFRWDDVMHIAESRARQLAATIITLNPGATELQVRVAFGERWVQVMEEIREDLVKRGLMSEYQQAHTLLFRIGAKILGELNGASSVELADLARRWLKEGESEFSENGAD